MSWKDSSSQLLLLELATDIDDADLADPAVKRSRSFWATCANAILMWPREIAGLSDFIAHAYFALDSDIIWDAVERDVPALLYEVRRIIRTETQGRD